MWKKDGIQNQLSDEKDYEGRLEEPFFKYVKRSKDYDQNEVPWPEKRGADPVQVQISAYLRFANYKTAVILPQILRVICVFRERYLGKFEYKNILFL